MNYFISVIYKETPKTNSLLLKYGSETE